jgi:hypothetical protein
MANRITGHAQNLVSQNLFESCDVRRRQLLERAVDSARMVGYRLARPRYLLLIFLIPAEELICAEIQL